MSNLDTAAGLTREEQEQAAKTLAEWERYVVALAFRMKGYAEVEDLMQVGRLGVLRAVRDHQPDRDGGMGLPGFVWLYIKQSMRNYIRANHSLVRVPYSKYAELRPRVLSMSAPLLAHEKSWEDILPAETQSAPLYEDERELLMEKLETLPPRIQFVLKGLDLEGRHAQTLADEMGVSRKRVYQLRDEGLELLRKRLGRKMERRAA